MATTLQVDALRDISYLNGIETVRHIAAYKAGEIEANNLEYVVGEARHLTP